MAMLASRRRAGRAAVAVALAGGVVACSGTSGGGGPTVGPNALGSPVANVTITASKGCRSDLSHFSAGAITFKIVNKDATKVSQVALLDGTRVVAETENVPAGLAGQFAVELGAGSYTLWCPGAAVERRTILVRGTGANRLDVLDGLLLIGSENYKSYVDRQLRALVTGTGRLASALHGTNLSAAQVAYVAAHTIYSRIAPVVTSIGETTQAYSIAIDARADQVSPARWSGFHKIEEGLFAARTLVGLSRWGDKLVADVTGLQRKAVDLTYEPVEVAVGAEGLLDEVASSKITGEEDRYAHVDIADMANNVSASQQAFGYLEPAVQKIDAILAFDIRARFAALNQQLDRYRTNRNVSGYVLYPTLTDTDRRTLAAAVKAVQELLSRVSGKVANA
jgi:iron uptake system component EfeO